MLRPFVTCPPNAAPPHPPRLQVKVLKNNWGLIRAVTRPTDVFFHFSNLVDVPEGELKVCN